jgi:hypothetical protein
MAVFRADLFIALIISFVIAAGESPLYLQVRPTSPLFPAAIAEFKQMGRFVEQK